MSSIIKATAFTVITSIITASFSQLPVHAGSESSLTQMPCYTTSAESGVNSWVLGSGDVPIGRQIYSGVAKLQTGWEFLGSSYIYKGTTAGVACQITPSGARPRYRTLRLSFGFSNQNSYAEGGSLAQLTVFLDGNPMKVEQIAKNELGYALLDVTNVRTVALEGECLRGGGNGGRSQRCPSIVFIQTLLE